jgi:hypothetical protein
MVAAKRNGVNLPGKLFVPYRICVNAITLKMTDK